MYDLIFILTNNWWGVRVRYEAILTAVSPPLFGWELINENIVPGVYYCTVKIVI